MKVNEAQTEEAALVENDEEAEGRMREGGRGRMAQPSSTVFDLSVTSSSFNLSCVCVCARVCDSRWQRFAQPGESTYCTSSINHQSSPVFVRMKHLFGAKGWRARRHQWTNLTVSSSFVWKIHIFDTCGTEIMSTKLQYLEQTEFNYSSHSCSVFQTKIQKENTWNI